jgi:hypothetical protein
MYSHLAADVLILNDGMILNGKIVDDKHPEYLEFLNSYGSFTINYAMIEKIYRTENYKEDVIILKNSGIEVNEDEIKKNYHAGEQLLDKDIEVEKNEPDDTGGIYAGIDFFYNRNFGDIKTEIPSGMGIFSSVKIPAGFIESADKLYISDIECGAGYLYSAEGAKSIQSLFFSAGPLWSFHHSIRGLDFNWSLSGLMGLGYYSVKNGKRETEGVKWNITIFAGPEYNFSSVTVNPRLRFDYIYDNYAPLISIGFSLGFGRIF